MQIILSDWETDAWKLSPVQLRQVQCTKLCKNCCTVHVHIIHVAPYFVANPQVFMTPSFSVPRLLRLMYSWLHALCACSRLCKRTWLVVQGRSKATVQSFKFSLPAIRNLAKSWHLSCKPRMRSADRIPMSRLAFVFFHWKCTQVLQKSLSLSINHACFKRYHHDLLRHLVAFSKFEWFISSDHKIKNFSTHFIHKL